MKKILLLIICICFLCGCGKVDKANVIKQLSNKITKSSSYTIDGKMQIISNEERFDYNIEVNYLKDDYYKVVLLNTSNNHEQIILRNKDGVYVITPSLNKSFKFQSEWPNNSSQAYVLESLLKDVKNDNNSEFESTDDGYILKVKVIYPNNSNLEYEKIYLDKDINLKKVEVYNKNDQVSITVTVNKIDYRANLDKDSFDLDNFVKESCCNKDEGNCTNPCPEECKTDECNKQTSSLDTAIYPLYVPENSSLTSNESINTDNGNRLILTFVGENEFVLIEEASKVYDDMEVIPVYGDPHILNSSVVALSANSLYWSDSNVDFYLASNTLSGEEMLTIAASMTNSQIVSGTK